MAASEIDAGIDAHARQMLETCRRVFRFDTFGSEAPFTDLLGVDVVTVKKVLTS